MFTGTGTALVTPFRRDGSLDESTLRALIKRQIDAGINFLVPCGTTGESPTLTHQEHLRVVEIAVELAKGKVPVLAGGGGYNTAEVITLARELADLGADGILSVTPYYNKPTQEGLYQHFKAIAEAVSLPIILYSVQGRTGVNIEPATVQRLSQIANIIGIKEASGNISQMSTILNAVPRGFPGALRRRCHHASADRAGRARGHLRRLQRNSRGDGRAHAARAGRRFRRARAKSTGASCRSWRSISWSPIPSP